MKSPTELAREWFKLQGFTANSTHKHTTYHGSFTVDDLASLITSIREECAQVADAMAAEALELSLDRGELALPKASVRHTHRASAFFDFASRIRTQATSTRREK